MDTQLRDGRQDLLRLYGTERGSHSPARPTERLSCKSNFRGQGDHRSDPGKRLTTSDAKITSGSWPTDLGSSGRAYLRSASSVYRRFILSLLCGNDAGLLHQADRGIFLACDGVSCDLSDNDVQLVYTAKGGCADIRERPGISISPIRMARH